MSFLHYLGFGWLSNQQPGGGTTGPDPGSVQVVYQDTVVGTGIHQLNFTSPTGAWFPVLKPEWSDGSGKANNIAGAKVTFPFTGTGIEVVTEKWPSHGIASVRIDGGAPTLVDLYAPAPGVAPAVVFSMFGLTNTNHVIEWEVTGTRNIASSDFFVTLDYFRVTRPQVIDPEEPTEGNWYVGGAPTANDSNNGSLASPFLTIQRMLNVIQPGQTGVIRAKTDGTPYRETAVPVNSGTAANRITIEIESGVVITGLNLVQGTWSVHNAAQNIYKITPTTPLPVTGYNSQLTSNTTILANQIFRNGEMQIEARWPKVSSVDQMFDHYLGRKYLLIAEFLHDRITDSDLDIFFDAGVNLTGATMISNGDFITESRTINSHNNNLITFNSIWGGSAEGYKMRRNYYVTNHLGLLSAEREFHYQGGILYYKQPGGGSPTGTIEYKARNWAFDLRGRSYFTINGGTFKGCEPVMGNDSSNFNIVDGIVATFTNHNVRHDAVRWQGVGMTRQMGVGMRGNGNILRNSKISYCASGAVWIGANGRVENNYIHHVGYDASFCYCIDMWGEDNVNNIVITRNTLHTVSRGTIGLGYGFEEFVHHKSTGLELSWNNSYNWGCLNQDGGATYSWGFRDHGNNSVMHHNWFHDTGYKLNPRGYNPLDGIQCAIYWDQASGPFYQHHNVLWGNCENLPADAADMYAQPVFQGGAGGFRDAGPSKLHHETYWSNAPTVYTTYSNTSVAEVRNSIFRKRWNNNHGAGATNIQNSMIYNTSTNQSPNPQFVASGLANPQLHFQLGVGSAARNAGIVIPGINNGYDGVAPDLGAYEANQLAWVPGCDHAV